MQEPVSRKGRLLAVGDIHGCLAQLKALLAKVAPVDGDRLVFLGDYLDRGPDSAGVIDYLLALRERHPQTIFLRGNHEQMFLDFLNNDSPGPFLENGGLQTLRSYLAAQRWPIPAAHRHFVDHLVDLHQQDGFVFVHAGLRPGIPVADQTRQDLLWIRHPFLTSDYDWGKTVVFGHTVFAEPLQSARRIGLDTGCVYGRLLTCCDVRSRQFWSA